jgi:hypothetical protein
MVFFMSPCFIHSYPLFIEAGAFLLNSQIQKVDIEINLLLSVACAFRSYQFFLISEGGGIIKSFSKKEKKDLMENSTRSQLQV